MMKKSVLFILHRCKKFLQQILVFTNYITKGAYRRGVRGPLDSLTYISGISQFMHTYVLHYYIFFAWPPKKFSMGALKYH